MATPAAASEQNVPQQDLRPKPARSALYEATTIRGFFKGIAADFRGLNPEKWAGGPTTFDGKQKAANPLWKATWLIQLPFRAAWAGVKIAARAVPMVLGIALRTVAAVTKAVVKPFVYIFKKGIFEGAKQLITGKDANGKPASRVVGFFKMMGGLLAAAAIAGFIALTAGAAVPVLGAIPAVVAAAQATATGVSVAASFVAAAGTAVAAPGAVVGALSAAGTAVGSGVTAAAAAVGAAATVGAAGTAGFVVANGLAIAVIGVPTAMAVSYLTQATPIPAVLAGVSNGLGKLSDLGSEGADKLDKATDRLFGNNPSAPAVQAVLQSPVAMQQQQFNPSLGRAAQQVAQSSAQQSAQQSGTAPLTHQSQIPPQRMVTPSEGLPKAKVEQFLQDQQRQTYCKMDQNGLISTFGTQMAKGANELSEAFKDQIGGFTFNANRLNESQIVDALKGANETVIGKIDKIIIDGKELTGVERERIKGLVVAAKAQVSASVNAQPEAQPMPPAPKI